MPADRDQLRALLTSQLHALLVQLSQRQDLAGCAETAAISDEWWEVVLSVAPVPRPQPPAGDVPAALRRILSVCSREPQTAKKIAGRINRKYSSHLRQQLAELCRRGLLQMTPDGYRLP